MLQPGHHISGLAIVREVHKSKRWRHAGSRRTVCVAWSQHFQGPATRAEIVQAGLLCGARAVFSRHQYAESLVLVHELRCLHRTAAPLLQNQVTRALGEGLQHSRMCRTRCSIQRCVRRRSWRTFGWGPSGRCQIVTELAANWRLKPPRRLRGAKQDKQKS